MDQETVAELGGAWQYIESYAAKNKKPALAICEKVLARVCEAVALILDTAERHAVAGTGAAA